MGIPLFKWTIIGPVAGYGRARDVSPGQMGACRVSREDVDLGQVTSIPGTLSPVDGQGKS